MDEGVGRTGSRHAGASTSERRRPGLPVWFVPVWFTACGVYEAAGNDHISVVLILMVMQTGITARSAHRCALGHVWTHCACRVGALRRRRGPDAANVAPRQSRGARGGLPSPGGRRRHPRPHPCAAAPSAKTSIPRHGCANSRGSSSDRLQGRGATLGVSARMNRPFKKDALPSNTAAEPPGVSAARRVISNHRETFP